jgi:hypothetical protein
MNVKIKSSLCILLCFIFFNSCSSSKVNNSSGSVVDVVESPAADVQYKPVIETNTESTVEKEVTDNVYKKKIKTSQINLHLGPGLYNTFSYVGFLKGLEKNRIKVTSISGMEMGALMAALYAKHKKSSLVEWELFKLLQGMGAETKVYSEKWRNSLKNLIQSNFARIDFNQLDIELKIPVWEKNHFVWVEEGSVEAALIQSLHLNQAEMPSEVNYSSLNFQDLKNDEEVLVVVDVLTQNQMSLNQEESFKNIIKGLTRINSVSKKAADIYFSLKFNASELDNGNSWQKNNPIANTSGSSVARKLNQLDQTKSHP